MKNLSMSSFIYITIILFSFMILSIIEGGYDFAYFSINFLTFFFSLLILVIVLEYIVFFWKKYIKKIENITFYKGGNDFIETLFVYFLMIMALLFLSFLGSLTH